MINQLALEIHENSKSKGFYDETVNIPEKIALIHSEASEALEADREDKYSKLKTAGLENMLKESDEVFSAIFRVGVKDTFQDELADIVIRVFDLAACKGIDIENHILAKMRYNSLRPHKHGKKY
jgi:NTP pyrophosphatase (non-canonical NTP hydrolase)